MGKAIKQYNFDRGKIVVLTKVQCYPPSLALDSTSTRQVYGAIRRTPSDYKPIGDTANNDADGYVNQYGLSRKVTFC